MLSRLINQVGEEDDFESSPTGGSHFRRQIRQYSFQWWHVVVAILILFPYISIFVLFGLVGNMQTETNNYYTTQQVAAVSSFGGQSIPTSQAGVGLSFTSSGTLQVGGGTTLYKNIVNIQTYCPSYLSMEAVGSQYYVISYSNKNTFNSTLQLVQMSSSDINEAKVVQILAVGYNIFEIVTLSDSSGIFVAICQDYSDEEQDAYVIAGQVANGEISLSAKSATAYADIYSVVPQIIALSENSFAIAYYNINPSVAATRYGTVDPSTLTISLSSPQFFANDSTNSTYFNLAPLTDSSYMLFYYDSIYENGQDQPGFLHALIATVSNIQTPADSKIQFSNTSVLNTAFLSYFFSAATLDNSTVIIAYIDALQNNAVVAQTVRAMDLYVSEIVFGSSWVVNGGASYEDLRTGLIDIDIQTISDNREFVVLYTDVSNNGAIVATAGQLTETNELLRVSPDFVIFGANEQIETVYSWGAIASGLTAVDNSQTAILVLQTNGNCEKSASASFAMLQRLPAPVGLSASTGSGNSLGVALTGSVSGLSSLVPGRVYYTNTKGNLIAAGYAGHTNSFTINGLNGQSNIYYIYDSTNNAYVTLESKVGIATASNTLYVQTESI